MGRSERGGLYYQVSEGSGIFAGASFFFIPSAYLRL